MLLAATAVDWYTARAGGLVAFALLTVSVLLGLGLAGRIRLRRWPQFAVQDVHRFAGILAGTFVALHGLAVLVDGAVPFGPADVLVPGLAPVHPLAVAAGVVAAELMAAVAVANALRRRIANGTWRRIHRLNLLVWLLALAHGIAAGSDTDQTFAIGLYALAASAVAGLLTWRLLRSRRPALWEAALWPSTASLVAGELVVALALGPLRPG
jgi:sulfoxide reductase heme-binding subunit YedZ